LKDLDGSHPQQQQDDVSEVDDREDGVPQEGVQRNVEYNQTPFIIG